MTPRFRVPKQTVPRAFVPQVLPFLHDMHALRYPILMPMDCILELKQNLVIGIKTVKRMGCALVKQSTDHSRERNVDIM